MNPKEKMILAFGIVLVLAFVGGSYSLFVWHENAHVKIFENYGYEAVTVWETPFSATTKAVGELGGSGLNAYDRRVELIRAHSEIENLGYHVVGLFQGIFLLFFTGLMGFVLLNDYTKGVKKDE